jgi:hypothetical protein
MISENYDDINASNHKLVFRKVMLPRESLNTPYDFNSIKSLQKISSMLKFAEDMQLDSQVYSDNKEFLIDLVNTRHSVIIQNLKHNVETLRKICTMDRNHRTNLKTKEKQLVDRAQSYKNNISIDNQIKLSNPMSAELINEINYLNYGGNLDKPRHDHNFISISEINQIISETAESFDTDVTLSNEVIEPKSDVFIYEFEGTDKTIRIEEIESPISNDINLSSATDKTVIEKYYSTINTNDKESKSEFFKIVATIPLKSEGIRELTQCEIFPAYNVTPVRKGVKRKFV